MKSGKQSLSNYSEMGVAPDFDPKNHKMPNITEYLKGIKER